MGTSYFWWLFLALNLIRTLFSVVWINYCFSYTFHRKEFKCHRFAVRECGEPPMFFNTSADDLSDRSLGATITYSCNSDLKFSDNTRAAAVTCEAPNPGERKWIKNTTSTGCYGYKNAVILSKIGQTFWKIHNNRLYLLGSKSYQHHTKSYSIKSTCFPFSFWKKNHILVPCRLNFHGSKLLSSSNCTKSILLLKCVCILWLSWDFIDIKPYYEHTFLCI